ncbi:DUF2705 family protein [Oceanobacillus sp. 1P07AA]|uniref:DUF2705 family protein n=1 Tax=Oceanobacillus sp. 1P07AA TaxID=3132293 RepID=UPI0039A73F2A
MGNFVNLVKNEQIKIYHLKSTWAMYILLTLFVVGGALISKFFGPEGVVSSDFQPTLHEYYMNTLGEVPAYDAWAFLYENMFLISVISLFTIIIASSIISNEFKWGTIKLLLIRPSTRAKILLSKYVSVFLFAITIMAFMMISSFIIGLIMFGVNGANPTLIVESGMSFTETTYLVQIQKDMVIGSASFILITTLAFTISTLFRSSAMAIGISIFLLLSNQMIAFFLSQYDWAKYILFLNMDLNQYTANGTPYIEGMTLGFSITMLIIYYIIFIAISWFSFTKRDVAGN